MKVRFSFALCCVFIYATICCANVAAEETVNVDVSSDRDVGDNGGIRVDEPCIVQYLKEKGRLNDDFPSRIRSSLCRFTMVRVLGFVRQIISGAMTNVAPKEADCFMAEYDKTQTVDSALVVAVIRTTPDLTEEQKENLITKPLNELKEKLNENADKCGVDEKMFKSVFGRIFESKGRRTTSSKDSSETTDATTLSA
ncbi:uncharacterized protein LOC119080262 [Bradysia coprophila]|uniref:uncharacterized protein LOC119080262 n=1 Tax=Bradysia coprophila TaxID=38358 RepID=UPI00187DAAAB|nr:uncharacterized protein LOC119080262 [Bradysia coprophila]